MRKNDIFEIEITGMTDDGSGVGRAEGMAVFVPHTIVGEKVRVVIVKLMKSYAIGKLLDITKASPKRVKADCEYYYKCGGCTLRHLSYDEELRFKQQKVADCLERIGGFHNIIINPIIAADSRCRYRNKSQFPVTNDGIGMFAAHSHRLIEVGDCLLANEGTKRIVDAVRFWMRSFGIKPYDEASGTGTVRNIYTRSGMSGTLVCIVTRTREQLPHADELISELKDCGANVCGVIQNINEADTNVVLGKEVKTLWGASELIDNIGKTKFYISPLAFYQVNKEQTERLYDTAKNFAGLTGGEIVWDMYCGIGTIGQYMADKCKKIIGVEIIPEAIENAVRNAALNNIENAEYYCGRAETVISKLVKNGEKPNTVVLDPPRKGCDKRLLETLCKIRDLNRIVYISCKPSTLARDAKLLAERGFKLAKVTPVDMFPGTPHVETVCLLSKA